MSAILPHIIAVALGLLLHVLFWRLRRDYEGGSALVGGFCAAAVTVGGLVLVGPAPPFEWVAVPAVIGIWLYALVAGLIYASSMAIDWGRSILTGFLEATAGIAFWGVVVETMTPVWGGPVLIGVIMAVTALVATIVRPIVDRHKSKAM